MAEAAPRFPRYLVPRLREALADSPAVLVHGPRQCGKTTLARLVGEPRGYRYVSSFDDEAVATAARADPVGFVSDLPARTILDEVQRVPEIFTSLKAAIDRRRTVGRFILTGSANVLLVPTLAESPAGRMAILLLHPLAKGEIGGRRQRFIERLFRAGFKTGVADRLGPELADRITAGGSRRASVFRWGPWSRSSPTRRRAAPPVGVDVAPWATKCYTSTMRDITQRELRNASAAVMDAVERGEAFRITRHGAVVAELRPARARHLVGVAAVKTAFARLPAGGFDALRADADAVFGEDRIGG